MVPSLFNSTTVPVLEQVVSFAQSRHEVLAGNIANMDTPGYKIRDLSVETFQDELRDAIEARKLSPEPWSPGLVESGDKLHSVAESMESILFHDESNVGLDKQVTEMLKNQSLHNMAIAIMSSQFQLLETAISERV